MTKMTNKVKNENQTFEDKCPKCGCDENAYHTIEIVDGNVEAVYTCEECNTEYFEIYEYSKTIKIK